MLTIRPAAVEDAGALTVIAQAAKRHWGYPEPWLAAWATVLGTPRELPLLEIAVSAVHSS